MTSKQVSQFMAENARKAHKVTYAERYSVIDELRKYTTHKELSYYIDRKNRYTTEDLKMVLDIYRKIK